ncbi:MAG TPA: hypothetical protein VF315_04995 [Steroidobacteraceae bacterium]
MKTHIAVGFCLILMLGSSAALCAARHPPTGPSRASVHAAARQIAGARSGALHSGSRHAAMHRALRRRSTHPYKSVPVYNSQNYPPKLYGTTTHRPSSFAPHVHSGTIRPPAP